jgi:hypothetical protein
MATEHDGHAQSLPLSPDTCIGGMDGNVTAIVFLKGLEAELPVDTCKGQSVNPNR